MEPSNMNIFEYYRIALELGNYSSILLISLSSCCNSSKEEHGLAKIVTEFYLRSIDALKTVSTAAKCTQHGDNHYKLNPSFVVSSDACQDLQSMHKTALELIKSLCSTPMSSDVHILPHAIEVSISHVKVQEMKAFFVDECQSTFESLIPTTHNSTSRSCHNAFFQPPISIVDVSNLCGEVRNELEIVSAIFLYNLGLSYLLRIPSASSLSLLLSHRYSSNTHFEQLLRTGLQMMELALQLIDEQLDHNICVSSSLSCISLGIRNDNNPLNDPVNYSQVEELEHEYEVHNSVNMNENLYFHGKRSQLLMLSHIRCHLLANMYQALDTFSYLVSDFDSADLNGDMLDVESTEAKESTSSNLSSSMLHLQAVAKSYSDCIYQTYGYVQALFQNPTFVIMVCMNEHFGCSSYTHQEYGTNAPAA